MALPASSWLVALLASACAVAASPAAVAPARALAAAAAPAPPETFISGAWYYGSFSSCAGKAFTPFNFSTNVCSPLTTDDLQVQFKGQSLRLAHPDAASATATLDVFADGACSGQPTKWGAVSDGACQLSYWSTKYTFWTNFTSV